MNADRVDDGAALADLSAGAVALYTLPSGERPLSAIPRAGFENLLVLSTSADLERLERAVAARGGDPAHVGVVPITGTTVDYDGPLWTTERANPSDLTGISIRFSEAFAHVRPGVGWVVVDNLGVLSMYVSEERLVRFVESITSATRERNAHCVLAATEGVLGERTLARLEGLTDRTVSAR
ncbi:hypothetical protein GCM10009037_05880 [Halarchaeum grantii]|uniref:DUF835 domain-containing protein n=1 Tax=Halarchaeum grantii TaxID=1193105 RepID=A0A830EU73_9EURY|nr:hypothetical protein [Halarchaeum grantii]GGL25147.1 hypothetical protein GCM10009037_05880 [Halarchaeum grantii]